MFYEDVFRKLSDKKVKYVQGIKIPLVSKEHLKELKTISARPQDIADIKALEMLENKDG